MTLFLILVALTSAFAIVAALLIIAAVLESKLDLLLGIIGLCLGVAGTRTLIIALGPLL